jgi:hypothetical protein
MAVVHWLGVGYKGRVLGQGTYKLAMLLIADVFDFSRQISRYEG